MRKNELNETEKSKQMFHQVNVNPSAPPVQSNKSSIHKQNFVHQSSYPGFEHVNQHQVGIKTDIQSEVSRHAPDPPTIPVRHQEQNERYCRNLYRHRRETGSIAGGL